MPLPLGEAAAERRVRAITKHARPHPSLSQRAKVSTQQRDSSISADSGALIIFNNPHIIHGKNR